MNLSPDWVPVFLQQGWEAVHWRDIGAPYAPDSEILHWARENGYIVFTHDLDFGAILAASNANSPSVIQVRAQDVTPDHLKEQLILLIKEYHNFLIEGALISLDENKSRARILPLQM